MDMPIGLLGLGTACYNFFYRAGCRTLRDVCLVVDGERKARIPERFIREAREAVKMQELLLGVNFLKSE